MHAMSKVDVEFLIKSKMMESGGHTQTEVAKNALHTSQPVFSRSLKLGSLTYVQVTKIAEYLGYDIIWKKAEEH